MVHAAAKSRTLELPIMFIKKGIPIKMQDRVSNLMHLIITLICEPHYCSIIFKYIVIIIENFNRFLSVILCQYQVVIVSCLNDDDHLILVDNLLSLQISRFLSYYMKHLLRLIFIH